ncbi:hypothetical protein CXK96_01195 [Stutzerimonas stutzeri]|nr:hypothetical protein CXK96_01195 [Stutzerimonas stutzeri]
MQGACQFRQPWLRSCLVAVKTQPQAIGAWPGQQWLCGFQRLLMVLITDDPSGMAGCWRL